MTLNESCTLIFTGLYCGLRKYQSDDAKLAELFRYCPQEFQHCDEQYQAVFNRAEKVVIGEQKAEKTFRKLTALFENIHLTDNDKEVKGTSYQYFYSSQQLNPSSIFPQKQPEEPNQQILWNEFLDAINLIPTAHKTNLPLWLDHFDTLLQCFFSQVPSGVAEDISLYDYLKTVSAFACVLSDKERDNNKEILLIQGDFFGIQEFIFSGGSETNKNMAKLLRGRSFQVSLFTELAALKLLENCHLPSNCQLMNAAGKFLIVAPNTKAIQDAIQSTQKELNDWAIKHTYGLVGVGLAQQAISVDKFESNHFKDLMTTLFKSLEKVKLQRLDLLDSTESVLEEKYPFGVCKLNSYFPAISKAEEDKPKTGLSTISLDQINIGEWLAKHERIIISNAKNKISDNHQTQKLNLTIFGYHVFFTESRDETGEFSYPVKAKDIVRFWDFGLPKNLTDNIWNGYAKRYINAYVPYFSQDGIADERKYKNLDENNKEHRAGTVKTFDYLACEDRTEKDDDYVGQAALMTLKGDVDNLGKIFQSGVKNPNFARTIALSRQMNQFFSLWLPAICAEKYPNMYTVFAGGDDFFLIGPWHTTQKLAFEMQQEFKRYVANNADIHFSAGMVMTKVGVPVNYLGHIAEEALEKAKQHITEEILEKEKKVNSKNAVTVYQQAVSWKNWQALLDLYDEIQRLATEYDISTSYLYSLIGLVNLACDTKNIESSMWRSRFYYRTARYVVDKLQENKKERALQEIVQSIGEIGINQHKQGFIIPLFNYFYQKRN